MDKFDVVFAVIIAVFIAAIEVAVVVEVVSSPDVVIVSPSDTNIDID